MTSAAQSTKSAITVRGSADIVCDYLSMYIFFSNFEVMSYIFLDYGINSILYQRGLYPPENFKPDENYGLTILMSTDTKIKEFLSKTLDQLNGNKAFCICCLIYSDIWLFLRLVSREGGKQNSPSDNEC